MLNDSAGITDVKHACEKPEKQCASRKERGGGWGCGGEATGTAQTKMIGSR